MADKTQREAIREVLLQLNKEGRLNPDTVVREARDPQSPLHSYFTWDVETAALKMWREEARRLISSYEITITVNRREYRIQEFVEAPGKANEKEQGYTSINRIRSNKELAREFVDRELAIAGTYVGKTKDYAEVLGLRKQVEEVEAEIGELRSELWGQTN